MTAKTKVKTMKKDTGLDDDGNLDLSIIRKPISETISSFSRLQKIYNSGTAEVKEILTTECDYMYECKVCKNIFRSIIHLISHKRVYCKENFQPSKHANFIKTMSLTSELLKLRELDLLLTEMQTENKKTDEIKDQQIPMTKDLTEIIEKLTAQKGISNEKIKNEIQQVTLQSIPTSKYAVYQSTPEEMYHMKVQVRELHSLLDKNEKIVLKEDGTLETPEDKTPQTPQADTGGVIHISDEDDDEHRIMCKICKSRFSTRKTLRFHLKTKHLSSRLVYPCPDCTELFSTSWSVYRHLFKVHKKTSAQVRKLREWVQSKTFRMDKVPPFYEKKKNMMKLAKQKAVSQNNKPHNWVENVEGDGECPRCGGCGRVFERRAALAAHAYTCQPRRALMRAECMQIMRKKPARIVDNTPSKEDSPESPEEDNAMDMEVEDSSSGASQNDNTEEVNDDNDNDTSPDYPETNKPKLNSNEKVEKKNLEALNKKMLPDVELDTLLCKKCNKTCPNMEDLLEHMANHYNWNRYSCKLCFYKNYHITKISEHIRIVHKLNGDSMFYLRTIHALEPADADVNDSESPQSSQEVTEEISTVDIPTPEQTNRKRKLNESSKTKKEKHEAKDGENSPDTVSLRSEENSSDIDDIENSNVFVATKRPIRKRSKPKYDDYEYDLSNLLKMEAQGYKGALMSTKVSQYKKIKVQSSGVVLSKPVQSAFVPASRPPSPFPNGNKDCTGALMMMSRHAVEISKAHMKLMKLPFCSSPGKQRIFAKPWSKSKDQSIKDNRSTIPIKEEHERVSLLKESYINKDAKSKNSLENKNNITEAVSKNKVTIPETKGLPKTESTVPESMKPKLQIKMIKNPLINKKLSAEILSKVVVLKQRISKDGEKPAIKSLNVIKIAPKPVPKINSDHINIKDIIGDITENGNVISVTTDKGDDSDILEKINERISLLSNNRETVTDT